MPIYIFQSPKTGEVKEILQNINDDHSYSEGGVVWQRIFTVPNAAIDTKNDIFDSKGFAAKTMNKKGSVGDLFDAAKEASEKREKITGKDPIKQDYFKKWSAKRKGKKHPLDRG
jgi:hypothetical protein